MDCGIVINVSDQEFNVKLGSLGNFRIPAKKDGEKFSLLVVEPAREVIDDGFGKSHSKEWEGSLVARDVAGYNSDQNYSRFGVFVCAATPEFSRDLERLETEEREFNQKHPRYYDANKNLVDPTYEEKVKQAAKIQKARAQFHAECRKMVTEADVRNATDNYYKEAQKLIVDADQMWARGPGEQKNISDRHRRAANLLGQERPWSYMPSTLVDCPACGGKIKTGVAICAHCNAILDREKAQEFGLLEPEPVGPKTK